MRDLAFFAVIFGIEIKKKGGKREFQFLVGAGFCVFITLGCESGIRDFNSSMTSLIS